MGWFGGSKLEAERKPELVFDHETLERDARIFNFPPEIPTVGQVVRVAYYANDEGLIGKIEATVTSRASGLMTVVIAVSSLTWGYRIGTQEFMKFLWDRTSRKWYFWDVKNQEYRPAIITF